MATMLSNGTLETDELLTRLTVQLQLSLLVVSTVEDTLLSFLGLLVVSTVEDTPFSFLLLLQGISKLKKIVDDKSGREACHSIGWNRSDLMTVGTDQD